MPGPGGTVAGKFPMLNHLSAASMEMRFSNPAPLFSMARLWVTRCGLDEEAEKVRTSASTLNWAGGDTTVTETTMVCDLPSQGLGEVQVTTTDPWYGVADDASESAPFERAMRMLPGVLGPDVTVNQDDAGLAATV